MKVHEIRPLPPRLVRLVEDGVISFHDALELATRRPTRFGRARRTGRLRLAFGLVVLAVVILLGGSHEPRDRWY